MTQTLEVDGKEYQLLWVETREALDEISYLRAAITDGMNGPDPKTLINKPIELTLSRKGGAQTRKFIGYVVESEHTSQREDEESRTVVVGRPKLHRLTQRSDCRIFQEMTAVDILKKVLEGAGVPAAQQKWQLEGTYAKRDYTTQYRETDWEFLVRLLSEEGIAFAIDMSSGKDVVTFFDKDLGPVEGDAKLPFGLGDGLSATQDGVAGIAHQKKTAPGKVHLRDYNFEKPSLKLDSKAEGKDDTEKALEVYTYPGRFTEKAVGDHYAKVLLEELQAKKEIVEGITNTLRLHPGMTYELEDHPYHPLNQEYLIFEVETRFEASSFSKSPERANRIHFRTIPKKTPYRPKRLPRHVKAPGAQVAFVTGPAGKEIHPDKHGRVKVWFPWDRVGKKDDTSSLWIRTCQLPLGGSMLTPRVGWEVYLNFTEGDPDEPFVCGRMYNGKTPPPYALPANKTRMSIQTATTPGGGSTNEIRMEDKKGSEEMFMNASKDASVSTGNNATEDVGNNETRDIGSNHKLNVTDSLSAKIGADQKHTISGNQAVNVSTFMVDDVGSHKLAISGNRDIKAGGDHKHTVTGDSKFDVNGMQIDLVAGSVDEQTSDVMNDKVGAVLIEMTPSNRTVTVTGARTETAVAAKVILSQGGRAVTVGGSLKQKVAGAILVKTKADRADSSAGAFLEVAGGAQLVKAVNVVFQAEDLLSVIMGASTITLTKASVSIAGVKITIEGDCNAASILTANN
jgi:type VI secretion system secreted protein VgrG